MFCGKCGKELGEGTKFCSSCGAKIITNEAKEKASTNDNNKVIAIIKPKFVMTKQILNLVKEFIILVLLLLYVSRGSIINALYYNPIIITAIIIVIGIGKLFFNKMEYKNLTYTFYGDRVEYIDGFLNKSRKNVKYNSIREIHVERTVFDRIFGVGKIKMTTSAESGTGVSGILIYDLVDADEIYEKIEGIVG